MYDIGKMQLAAKIFDLILETVKCDEDITGLVSYYNELIHWYGLPMRKIAVEYDEKPFSFI